MTSKKFEKYVVEHVEKSVHLVSVYYDLNYRRLNFNAEKNQREKDSLSVAEKNELATLETHMLAAFGLVRMNTAVHNFKTLLTIIKKLGGTTGKYLQSRYAVMEMIKSISDEMHATILNNLIRTQKLFSLLFDSSSDANNRHYLLIYIMTQEGSNQVAYLYRMVQMGKTSAAVDYLSLIEKQFLKTRTLFTTILLLI